MCRIMQLSLINTYYQSCVSWLIFTLPLLTPRCRILLEQLTGLQLVKKFPAFHGTQRFITALTSVRHLSLSWASPIQSIYPHPTSWRSILILSYPSTPRSPQWYPSLRFPTKTLYTPLSLPIRATCPAHLFLFIYIYIYIHVCTVHQWQTLYYPTTAQYVICRCN